jgi:pyruvate kinase
MRKSLREVMIPSAEELETREAIGKTRRTKIVVTLGPSCRPAEIIRQLVAMRVDVFRINASHGSHEEHARQIGIVRRLGSELGFFPGILLDLQGPKIRMGRFEGGSVLLRTGSRFTIRTNSGIGNSMSAFTSYADLAADIGPGDRILLADGNVELRALKIEESSVVCRVTSGGLVRDHQGINLPGVKISTPSLTAKDLIDLEFGLANHVDLVALSFVREASDVQHLRNILSERGKVLPIIAKIEKPEACERLDSIVEAADGVMVARGDLGVEVSLPKVPALQKAIIECARLNGKFVITATQMLESMRESPTPTRAEVSDVANAIYDGTDALMLSAETATGKYPVEASRMMVNIALEVEDSLGSGRGGLSSAQVFQNHAHIIADACCRAAEAVAVKAIVVFTVTGAMARLVAAHRPCVPIYAFTTTEAVARSLAVVYGVRPFQTRQTASPHAILKATDEVLIRQAGLKPADSVVVVAGEPMGSPGSTNLIRLHRVGETFPFKPAIIPSSLRESSSEHQS